MKELLEIIKTAQEADTPMALATIIQTAGSSYRHAGARMLILPDGRTVGCISGGCLDQDLVLHGLNVIANEKPAVISYDTRSEHDVIMGVGLGCKGVIEILVEFLRPRTGFLTVLDGLIRRRRTAAVATVINVSGDPAMAPGDRVILDDLGEQTRAVADPQTAEILGNCARKALGCRTPEIISHQTEKGTARFFVETIFPQTNLALLGAGHDAMPLARLAHALGLRVIVVDGRPGYVTKERFPTADERVAVPPEELLPEQLFDARTAAVIMTHNYLIDQAWLKQLLPLQLPYLGLMGPRKRAEKMFLELSGAGFEIDEQDMASLHNPVGLDIGAETPEQIALAILAEVQAALSGHEGGKLRQKKGAIHMRPVETAPERNAWLALA